MHNVRIVLFAAVSLALITRLAFADGDPKKASPDLVGKVVHSMFFIDDWNRAGPAVNLADTPDPSECTDAIAKYGPTTAPDDLLWGAKFKSWPGAKEVSGIGWTITFADAPKVCDTYAKMRAVYAPIAKYKIVDPTGTPLPKAADYGRGQPVNDDNPGTVCLAGLESAFADGAPHDVAVPMGKATSTLDQLRERCTAYQADYEADLKKIRDDQAAMEAAIRDAYTKVGIKGDRLALFVGEGLPEKSGFYYAGCSNGPTTAAEMKKAKKLFQWSEGSDGITLHKFVFHGDKYTESDRTFDLKEHAYAWCK